MSVYTPNQTPHTHTQTSSLKTYLWLLLLYETISYAEYIFFLKYYSSSIYLGRNRISFRLPHYKNLIQFIIFMDVTFVSDILAKIIQKFILFILIFFNVKLDIIRIYCHTV